jgi:hypothetical protein
MIENKINIFLTYPFRYQKFSDFIDFQYAQNKLDFSSYEALKNNINYYKTLQDLAEDPENIISNNFSLFLDTLYSCLKSKNKSSSNFNDQNGKYLLRKKFFEEKHIFHHHLISSEVYESKVVLRFEHSTSKYVKTSKNVIDGKPISEEIDNIKGAEKGCQTSNWCLHYQRDGDNYRLLFITFHPKTDEWGKIYKDFEMLL